MTATSDPGAASISAYEPRDWHDVPKGFYAIPIYDWANLDNDKDTEIEQLGYELFERKPPQQLKSGKTRGKDEFTIGKPVLAGEGLPGGAAEGWARFRQEIASDRFRAQHVARPLESPGPGCRCNTCSADFTTAEEWRSGNAAQVPDRPPGRTARRLTNWCPPG